MPCLLNVLEKEEERMAHWGRRFNFSPGFLWQSNCPITVQAFLWIRPSSQNVFYWLFTKYETNPRELGNVPFHSIWCAWLSSALLGWHFTVSQPIRQFCSKVVDAHFVSISILFFQFSISPTYDFMLKWYDMRIIWCSQISNWGKWGFLRPLLKGSHIILLDVYQS